MSSRSTRRERSSSRSPDRSRPRSKHYRSRTSSSHYHKDSSLRRNTNPHDRNNSKSRSYSYSNANSNSRSRSRSRSRTSDGSANKQNCRENAELPSDHPLFSIVTKERQNQKQNSTPSQSPQHNEEQKPSDHQRPSERIDTSSNYQRSTDRDRPRHHNDHRDRNNNNNKHHKDYRDRGTKDYRRRARDRPFDNQTHPNGHKYGDVSNLHSKFELNFHTGHKQQVLKKKKAEEAPQITATQAQQIIAVTTIVQKQEEITEIVETQQRKLKQKTSLERIKEKILLQKQQMMAQKKKKISTKDDESKHHVFVADLVRHKEETLPNMTQMMNGPHNESEGNDAIDTAQRQAIENLAAFVKKHGNALEQTVRDRSKDDPKFSWLYDEKSKGYQYYQLLLQQIQTQPQISAKKRKRRKFSAHPQHSESMESPDDIKKRSMLSITGSKGCGADKSLDKMNAYISKLEDEEKGKRDSRYDRSNQMSVFNGGTSHHIGDYLPEDELTKFNSKRGNKEERYRDRMYRLTHRNKGHAMLKKLGWNEGKGLGRNEDGITNPISAMISKKENNAGIGGNDTNGRKPWDPTPGDDQFDLYKKKMMLSYRYRPNPLGNPRKDYY